MIENLAGRNIEDTPLNSSTRQFPLRVPYEGVFDFLGDFVTLLSRFGRAVATWNWSNLTEPYLRLMPIGRSAVVLKLSIRSSDQCSSRP